MDVLVIRHHGDLNLDALFDANRVVENIDEIVERRIRLATVDVPDGDGGRLVALRANAAGTEQQPAGERQRKNDADHPSHTHNPHSYRCLQQIGKRSSLTAHYAIKTLSAHRLAEPKYSI